MTEGHLRLTEKLLCEQRRNSLGLPARGRRTGHQCPNEDSRLVVLGGVTPAQGDRESRSQGEGVYRLPVPGRRPQTALGCPREDSHGQCDQRNGTLA